MTFAYKHVDYSGDLWWQFAFRGNAPRSLRAMAAVTLITLVYTSSLLLRSKPKEPDMPTESDLETVRQIVAGSPQTSANLALLGDKYFLFNDERTSLIMYAVEGRSWVSMGDPIGDPQAYSELVWDFRERCDEGGRWPVFYQVDEARVAMYAEMGLAFIKLGEQGKRTVATGVGVS